jgi:hypothetical protein
MFQRTDVKKNFTTLGRISINNENPFSQGLNGFQISPRMQELIVYAGQLDCYDRCHQVIQQFLDVEVGHTQAQRVTDVYGEELGKAPTIGRTMPPVKKQETLYVQADGSMVLTREDGWKEVKLGRIFKSGDCLKADEKVGFIRHSQYLAHLGDARTFTTQLDELIESYGKLDKRLVFISDGAVWIRNWIEDSFPQAESILDYYHASQHLFAFAERFFTNKKTGDQWSHRQCSLLLSSQVNKVLSNIRKLAPGNKAAQQLIEYYQNNKARMDYKHYQQIGCGIIGSGAIESAHRTVIQKRMKLSGQRWSKKGAQNMLNLRVTQMNGQWSKVIELTKTNFRAAA